MKNTAKPQGKYPFKLNFNLMILGQIISLFGSFILRFTLSLYVLDVTGSAGIFSVILAVSIIPQALLSPLGGAIADRVNRRNLMVIFDFSSCALIVLLTVTILLSGELTIPLIGAVMVLLSVISTFYQPAVQASIPVLVGDEHLMQANGLVTGVQSLANLLGPVAGGVLYSLVDTKVILVISAVSFFCSAVMEIFIKIPFTKPEREGGLLRSIWIDICAGLRYILREDPFLLKVTALSAIINFVFSPIFSVGAPFLVKMVLGFNDTWYGISQGAFSLSMILASLVVGQIGKKLDVRTIYRPLLWMGLIFFPIAGVVSPLLLGVGGNWPSFLAFMLLSMCTGFFVVILNVFIMAKMQERTPNELLGKVTATSMAVSICVTPIGQIIFGGLFDALASQVWVILFAVGAVVVLVALWMKYLLRNQN